MNNSIYRAQSNNVFKTWFFLILFSLLVGLIGFILASYFQSPFFLYFGTLASIGLSIWSFWNSGNMVLRMAHARILENGENQNLETLVQQLSFQANIPTPKIFIIDDPSPNAFATGRNPQNGVIAFTTGILSLLNKDELSGVIAHELSHIVNRDTLVMTVVAVMASFVQSVAHFAYFFGGNLNDRGDSKNNIFLSIIATLVITILAPLSATLIQLAISRSREFLADKNGVKITNYPQGLAGALQKIANYPQGMKNIDPSIAHLFISNPEKNLDNVKTPWYMKLFLTHPPLNERIEALLGLPK